MFSVLSNSYSSWSSAKKGLVIALLATLCYSLKPIIIKLIYVYDVSSVNVLAWRMIMSLPIYLLIGFWVFRKHQEQKGTVKTDEPPWLMRAMILGIIGYYLAALLDLVGLQYISSQLARLILFTYPTLVAVLGWLIYRQALNRTVVIALLLSYIGVGLIFMSDLDQLGDQVMFGSFVMFLSVLSFSLYVLLSKPLIDQVGGTSFTVVAMLSSGVCVLIHFLATTENISGLAVSWPAFSLIFVMTMLTTVIPSFLIAEAISLIGPQKTAIAGTFGPAATSIFAVFLLGEAFGVPQLLGLILVVVAISYMQRGQSPANEDAL